MALLMGDGGASDRCVAADLSVMRVVKTLALMFIVTVCSVSTAAQVAKVLPIDEAAQDPEFFAFRARLLVALQQKDAVFLYDILAADILNSFGGDGGIEEFKAQWKAEEPTSKVWLTLTDVLALGGQFQSPNDWSGGARTFVAPYTFAVKPSAGAEPFLFGIVVGRGVRVRQNPTAKSNVLATLSFDVVRVTDWAPKSDGGPEGGWIAVELTNGRTGYIASEFIRSSIGYRAIFVNRDGRWLLKALVAGD
jgi:hypothetical protein